MEAWTEYVSTHVPKALPGIREIMAEQLRRGGSIAVISHSLRRNILRHFRENGLPEPSMVFGWELPREKRKPDPFALDRLMAAMDLSPADMLVVDDLKPGCSRRPARQPGRARLLCGDPRLPPSELPPVFRFHGGAVPVSV